MKLHTALFLFLASVSVSAARADTGKLAGQWHGTYTPSPETSFDLQVDENDGVYLGHYLATTRTTTSFPVMRDGQAIRFSIPNVGIFQGQLHGDVLEGVIVDDGKSDPVRFEKTPESNFPDFVD